MKKKGAECSPKFTKKEKDAVLDKVETMRRRGYPQQAIGRVIGVSQAMVCKYLKEIQERKIEQGIQRGLRERIDNKSEINYQAKVIREVIVECWQAWQDSKEPRVEDTEVKALRKKKTLPELREEQKREKKEQATVKRGKKKEATVEDILEMVTVQMTRTQEGRLPSSHYLAVILDALRGLRQLYGLNAPVEARVEHTAKLNWSEILDAVEPDQPEDLAEKAIAEVRELGLKMRESEQAAKGNGEAGEQPNGEV